MIEPNVAFDAPFPGLRPFEPEEAPLFFGRGSHIAEMLVILHDQHFLAVVGSSGCGKSSLVRAGLLPALSQGLLGDNESRWRFVMIRPGGGPFDNLSRELVRQLECGGAEPGPAEVAFCRATLSRGPNGLFDAIADTLPSNDLRVLVLVDQFEELFRSGRSVDGFEDSRNEVERDRDRNEAFAFVDLLLATARAKDPRVYIALTMRSDYLGNCDIFRDLPEMICRRMFLPPRLTREELRDAIERPAMHAQFHGVVAPEVASELMAEMGNRQDQLPLIQHALLSMWKLAEQEIAPADGPHPTAFQSDPSGALLKIRITHAHYDKIGGVANALNQHAELIYARLSEYPKKDQAGNSDPDCGSSQASRVSDVHFDSIENTIRSHSTPSITGGPAGNRRDCGSLSKQWISRKMFCALCENSGDGRSARRLSSVSEVAAITGATVDQIQEVVAEFTKPGVNFLVASPAGPLTDATQLDISHECLIRHWHRLNDWLKQEEDSASRYVRLAESAQLYFSGQEELLGGRALEAASAWFDREQPNSAWGERYAKGLFATVESFLQLSNLHEQEQKTKQDRLRRQNEQVLEPARRLLRPPTKNWRHFVRRYTVTCIVVAAMMPNALASVFNTIYNLKAIVETLGDAQDVFWRTQITVNAITFPLGLSLLATLSRPVAVAARRSASLNLATDELARYRKRCLGLGRFSVWIGLTLWLIAAPIYPIILQLRMKDVPLVAYSHFIASLALCGLIASAYPFFIISYLAVSSLYPALVRIETMTSDDVLSLRRLEQANWFYLLLAASVPMLSVSVLITFGAEARFALALLAAGGVAGLAVAFVLFKKLQADLETLMQVSDPSDELRESLRELIEVQGETLIPVSSKASEIN